MSRYVLSWIILVWVLCGAYLSRSLALSQWKQTRSVPPFDFCSSSLFLFGACYAYIPHTPYNLDMLFAIASNISFLSFLLYLLFSYSFAAYASKLTLSRKKMPLFLLSACIFHPSFFAQCRFLLALTISLVKCEYKSFLSPCSICPPYLAIIYIF